MYSILYTQPQTKETKMATLYRVPLDVDPQEVKAFDLVDTHNV